MTATNAATDRSATLSDKAAFAQRRRSRNAKGNSTVTIASAIEGEGRQVHPGVGWLVGDAFCPHTKNFSRFEYHWRMARREFPFRARISGKVVTITGLHWSGTAYETQGYGLVPLSVQRVLAAARLEKGKIFPLALASERRAA